MDRLTQTEYLEETVLRAEARSCAGRRGCSQPWDAAVPAGAAVSQHWDVVPCEKIFIYIYIVSHGTGGEASARSHCFQFLSFEIKTKNFWFGSDTLRFSSPAHPPFVVVRHDSIAYRHSDGTSIFRVVSSCFAGTDVVHPYTATSRVRFIRGPVVTRKRRGVGRQRVIARSDYLTQTE